MKPIAPPTLLNTGIAVYFPAPESEQAALIGLDIFYSRSNPVFSWLACDHSQARIWSKKLSQSANGTLFLYETTESLPLGFYTIVASQMTSTSQMKKGQLSIGIISPTPRLIIGLPYSIYPVIDLA